MAGAHAGEQMLLHHKNYDPAIRPQMAPLQRYHREVWIWQFPELRPEDALNIKELNEAFTMAERLFNEGKTNEGGTIGLALQSAAEVGWKFTKAFTIQDHEGEEIDL